MSKKQNRWRRLLRKAANLLEKGDTWTKGYCAEKINGELTSTLDPFACKFCMVGAIAKVSKIDIYAPQGIFNAHNKYAIEASNKMREKGFWYNENDYAMRKEVVIAKLREVANSD